MKHSRQTSRWSSCQKGMLLRSFRQGKMLRAEGDCSSGNSPLGSYTPSQTMSWYSRLHTEPYHQRSYKLTYTALAVHDHISRQELPIEHCKARARVQQRRMLACSIQHYIMDSVQVTCVIHATAHGDVSRQAQSNGQRTSGECLLEPRSTLRSGLKLRASAAPPPEEMLRESCCALSMSSASRPSTARA